MALFGRPTANGEQRAVIWRQWPKQRNPLAIASLVLGVFSLIEFGALLVFGITGIILGMIAIIQLTQLNPQRPRGFWMALFGIALNVASLVIAVFFVYRWV